MKLAFWRRREDSLQREIDDYLDRETAHNLMAGMSREQARAEARRKLGNLTRVKEETRAAWGWMWLESLGQDIVHGTRMFTKNPGFTAVAVLSIALGTGANCAMFSTADGLLFRPFPVADPGSLITVGTRFGMESVSRFTMSHRDYADVRDRSESFTGLAAYSPFTAGISASAKDLPEVRTGALLSGTFFDVMGLVPEIGRSFRADEDAVAGRDAVVVLSHDFWQSRFQLDPAILGRKLRINSVEFTIIGVAPAAFHRMETYERFSFFVPLMMWQQLWQDQRWHPLEDRALRFLNVYGRLRPGVSLDRARAEVSSIARGLAQSYPSSNRDIDLNLLTDWERRLAADAIRVQISESGLGLSLVVLLAACANLAGLLLSRAPVRAREIAMKLAIGAGRNRLIRQLITENLLLAAVGGLAGLLVGWGLIRIVQRLEFSGLGFQLSFDFDQRVWMFSLAATLACVFLFGLLPALQTTKVDLSTALKTSTGQASPQRMLGRNVLVSFQVGVALMLLTVAAVLYQGLRGEFSHGPGYRTDHLLMMSFDPRLQHYGEERTQDFYRELVRRAAAVPGVASASMTSWVPLNLTGFDFTSVIPESDRPPAGESAAQTARVTFASHVEEHYFGTMAIPLTRGRGFTATDNAGAKRVAIVNDHFAQHYWPNQDPLGKRFRNGGTGGPWVEIIGTVATSKYLWLGEPAADFVYLPLRQNPSDRMTLLVEATPGLRDESAALMGPLRDVVKSLDPFQPIFEVTTMHDFYQRGTVAAMNTSIQISGAMGAMGVLLSMIGLSGLMAYSVNCRTREIGIRMAIGANPGSVLRMVLRQGIKLGMSGIAIGLVASLAAGRILGAAFAGTAHVGLATYLGAAVALLSITLVAAYIPARRASLVDPTVALRQD